MSFQFVFCGLASFAATMGYVYTQRRLAATQDVTPFTSGNPLPTGSETNSSPLGDDKEYSQTEPMSLKRKSIDDHNSLSDRPRKRSKSPPVEAIQSVNIEATVTSPIIIQAAPTLEIEDVTMGQALSADVVEKPVKPEDVNLLHPKLPEIALEEALAPVVPITPPSSPPFTQRPRGFAAFAGAGSPFAVSTFSPNGPLNSMSSQRPVWCNDANPLGDRVSPSSTTSPRSDAIAGVLGPAFGAVEKDDGEPAALAAVETRVSKTVAHVTGEEDEIVKSELKGVKLFVKRGTKGFTGGMPGHVKLLSHSQRPGERLLFRREPLGKVSMNVSVGPTVRCSFDAEDNVLRVVLKEAVEDGNGAQELVVYAIKRGRVPKHDFTEFAETLAAYSLQRSTAAET